MKKYIKPAIEIVLLSMEHHIAIGSEIKGNASSQYETLGKENSVDNYSVWDDHQPWGADTEEE